MYVYIVCQEVSVKYMCIREAERMIESVRVCVRERERETNE